MALIIADGFDIYRTGSSYTSDLTTYGQWTGYYVPSSTSYATTTTRFGVGNSLQIGRSGNYDSFWKSGFTSTDTVYFSVAVYSTGATGYFYWMQGGTTHVRIDFDFSAGNIRVYRGDGTTLLGTYTAGIQTLRWFHFQVKVVINNSTGEVRIRKNGNTTDDYVLTSQDTQNTANAYADQFQITSAQYIYVDDLVVFDSSGSSINTWTGDVRCHTLLPSAAGSSTDFTNAASSTLINPGMTGTMTANAGDVVFTPFIAIADMTLSKYTMPVPQSQSGSTRTSMGLYADSTTSPGTPGAKIANTGDVTSPQAGLVDYTFSSPPTLTRGTRYWAAYQTEWSANAYLYNAGTGYRQTTYSYSWWTNYTPSSQANSAFMFYIVGSTANGNFVSVNSLDLDLSYNYASTVGNDDLFAMDNLPSTPASILAVQQKVIARKTDSGLISLQTELKSGATTVQGTGTALGASYAPLVTLYATDPNTDAAWTADAVNAIEAGYKISS